jgi:hypothetical protein
MKIKFLEQISFKLAGRSVPVMRVSEVEQDTGKINTLQDIGTCKDSPNRLVETWDNRGWEKTKDVSPITRLNAKGDSELCWVVSARGQTVNLYTQPWLGPALEEVIGKAATVDDIATAMDLTPSMRDKIVWMIIGIMLGWLIVGPMINTVLK